MLNNIYCLGRRNDGTWALTLQGGCQELTDKEVLDLRRTDPNTWFFITRWFEKNVTAFTLDEYCAGFITEWVPAVPVGVKVMRCETGAHKWYSSRVGDVFPFGGLTDTWEWRTNEPAGYVNFIAFEDGEIVYE